MAGRVIPIDGPRVADRRRPPPRRGARTRPSRSTPVGPTRTSPEATDVRLSRPRRGPRPASARLAQLLAFLRRRLERRLHGGRVRLRRGPGRARAPARAAAALQALVPGRGAGHREHPRATAARWSWPTTRARSRSTRLMTQVAVHDEHPGQPAPADARRRPRLPDPGHRRAGPQGRVHARDATPTPSGCCPAASWSASGPRASRASASRSPSGTSCSGSAAAASSRRRCGPAYRSSRARSSAPRRSTRSSATSSRWPGCSACRTCR